MGSEKGKSANVDVVAVNEVYKIARSEADAEIAKLKEQVEGIKKEYLTRGIVQMIEYDKAHKDLIRYAALYQLKQEKAYRAGGMTWDEFCVSIGEERRTVDRIFDDLSPIYETFSGKLSDLIGIKFSKIRHLGKSITGQMSEIEDGCLVFDGEKIPLDPEHKEDIEAVIDKMRDVHRQGIEEAQATIKARDRILKEKERVIINQEKDLAKFKRNLEEKGLAPGEEDFLKQLGKINIEVTGILARLEPDGVDLSDASPRMVAVYLETLGYIRRYATALHDTAVERFGRPDIDGGWQQPGDGIPQELASSAEPS